MGQRGMVGIEHGAVVVRSGTPANEPARAKTGTRLKTYSRTLSLKPPPLRSGTMAIRAWSR